MNPAALIAYPQFAKLQLRPFLLQEPDLEPGVRLLEDWEFMGGLWLGEAIGFTEFLRHTACPRELGSMSVHLSDLPGGISNAIFAALRLPLTRGMSGTEVQAILGPPEKVHSFVPESRTYEFSVDAEDPYYVSCTIDEGEGLTYVVVIRKDILALCETDA